MIQDRLQKLGIQLPNPPEPLAAYIPARKSGNLIYISGQLPLKDGNLMMTGPMIPGRSIDEAKTAMAQCFINGLSAATQVCDIESIKGVVRLGAYVAGTTDFTEQHLVANGASEIIPEIFGKHGLHARAAVGVSSLPLNATVELEIIFEISE